MQDRIRISCSRQNLQQVRDFVRDFLLAGKRSEVIVNQVVLAVDEVVANFIIHANEEDSSQFLDLILVLVNHRLEIEIEDHGSNLFLPRGATPTPDLREYIRQGRRGGMGMALVSRIMDRVEFFERNSHTICHLTKELA
ncbi:ATP-binding protein [Hymenobacter sp. HMF4947]|uniref:ATP-binding protein n=1 Tax=Hymenobacter ginkgonis TaxID=2682976 RepID=A0A7K1TED5_9BACT|nr:ATP-binding protein [Hymenobacter ginkgonis]MVN76760.1 ATP-binding protein [Hymenobacter ginkgonis]